MGVGVDVGVNENGHLIGGHKSLFFKVARDGIEPPTHGFSVRMSPNLVKSASIPVQSKPALVLIKILFQRIF